MGNRQDLHFLSSSSAETVGDTPPVDFTSTDAEQRTRRLADGLTVLYTSAPLMSYPSYQPVRT